MSLSKERQLELADPAIVDAIVRQVVQRITDSNHETVAIDPSYSDSSHEPNSSQLKVNEKVITMETLRGRLDGMTSIEVEEKSIVTPAVKDELRSRGITIEQAKSSQVKSTPGHSKSQTTFCVARLSNHFVAAEWLKEFGRPRICCGDDYDQLGENLEQMFSDSKTICFAAQPFVAAAKLNRHSKLRAAFARTEKDMAEIHSTLDANVLVLDTVQSRQEQLGLIRIFMSYQKGTA